MKFSGNPYSFLKNGEVRDMKIKTIPASEQVFDYIKNAIVSGEWKVNERIPSEIEMAERFGVNRLTVRMALKKLVALGILETRTGDGTYVREFHFRDYISQIKDFYMTPELLRSVYQFRRVTELECGRLAIQTASDEEIGELRKLYEEYQEMKEQYPGLKAQDGEDFIERFVRKDIEYHCKIVSMSHNELFVYSYDVAREPIARYVDILVRKRIESWKKKGIQASNWNDQHREMFEAICRRDFPAYQKALEQMVDFEVDLAETL